MTKDAQLIAGDVTVSLPFVEATEGNNAYSIASVLKDTGDATYDVGFANTAACSSAITFIDGDAGILRYRGYPIDQIAEKSTFMETCFLVLYGELPSTDELAAFEKRVVSAMAVDGRIETLYQAFPKDAHPMHALGAALNALGAYDEDVLSWSDQEKIDEASIRLLAKMPTIAAYGYRSAQGKEFIAPDPSKGYVENFLHMMFGDDESRTIDEATIKALDVLLILHADHEQNCSTSTVRLVGSAQADLFASIAAGSNALSGPLHGGANQQVVEMLTKIQQSGGDVDQFMQDVKDKKDGVKLMGFGHRVYKNYDPRAKIIKVHADQMLSAQGGGDQLLEIAKRLEEIALKDDYFVSRKLYPNVDFYTGLIYQAMGFPVNMFTVLFALGRMPGWIAQWREMNQDKATKIGRPRQVYIGATEREYVPADQR